MARAHGWCGEGLSFVGLGAGATQGLSSTARGWKHRPQMTADTRDPISTGSWINITSSFRAIWVLMLSSYK